jgi:hypothetical protein
MGDLEEGETISSTALASLPKEMKKGEGGDG